MRALTVREIQAFLREMYAIDVSPDLISTVTDAILSEVTAWQTRPLEAMYPVVFFDALRVKMRDDAVMHTKAVYLALAVLPDGTREVYLRTPGSQWLHEYPKGVPFVPKAREGTDGRSSDGDRTAEGSLADEWLVGYVPGAPPYALPDDTAFLVTTRPTALPDPI